MSEKQAHVIEDLTRASVLEVKIGFDDLWLRSLAGLEIETAPREQLEPALLEVASGIEALFRQMAEERERVEIKHPWQFGMLLAWLAEQVGETLGRLPIARFDLLQRAGYWADREFKEWASEVTGVGYSTWSGWAHAVRVFLLSAVGDLVLEIAEVSKEQFVGTTPMGKAQRAVARVAAGRIEEHQVKALVDPGVTEAAMRHALRSSKTEWEQKLEDQANRDEAWVAHEGPKSWIDYSPLDGRMLLKQVDQDGVYTENLVCRMPLAAQPLVEVVQQAMLVAAEKVLEDLVSANEVLEDFESDFPGVSEEFIALVTAEVGS